MGIHDAALGASHLQSQNQTTQAPLPPAVVHNCKRVAGLLKGRLPQLLRSANWQDLLHQEIKRGLGPLTGSASLAGADIEAVAFLVLIEAAKAAQEDLKAIMDGVKAINKQKEGWRQVQDTVNKQAASSPSRSRYARRPPS
jgi:hypothetical protein